MCLQRRRKKFNHVPKIPPPLCQTEELFNTGTGMQESNMTYLCSTSLAYPDLDQNISNKQSLTEFSNAIKYFELGPREKWYTLPRSSRQDNTRPPTTRSPRRLIKLLSKYEKWSTVVDPIWYFLPTDSAEILKRYGRYPVPYVPEQWGICFCRGI